MDAYLKGIELRKEKARDLLPELKVRLGRMQRERTQSQLYFKLGVCHDLLEMEEQALQYYDRSIQIRPQQAVVYLRRGLLQEAMGRQADAEADLRRGLALENASTVARLHLALFLCRDGRAGEAEELLSFLREHQPEYAALVDDQCGVGRQVPVTTPNPEKIP